MKYHQIQSKLSKKQKSKILDWATRNASTFSLVWRENFQFKKSAKDIEKKLEKYLERVELTNDWPGTKVIGPADTRIHFYRVTKKSSKLLKEFGPIFRWLAPKYPEDLAFYDKKRKPIFGSVAHEKMAFIIGKKKYMKKALRKIGKIMVTTLN
jgi:hypothetical protein